MSLSNLALQLATHGPQGAAALRKALGVSPATLSRMVEKEEGAILRLGKARATRYALRRKSPGLPGTLPIFKIDENGGAKKAGELTPVTPGSWLETSDGKEQLYRGLPPALMDMSPAGYLGRRFVAHHQELALPSGLADWSDDHRLIALARRGEDVPGDLIVGEESLDRFFAAPVRSSRRSDSPRLAELSAVGGGGASSGEQPQFASQRDGRHFLVKFTFGDGSPSDARWRDLLVCEELALSVLSEAGIAAARAKAYDVGKRRFLEVERSDRVGGKGRRGLLTLGPLDDELFGGRDSWTDAAGRLRDAGLLSPEDARRVRLLEAYGICIANGERHFGNLAFFGDGLLAAPALVLAPAYNMFPADAAPRAGFVPALPEGAALPQARLLDVWGEAAQLAEKFWERVSEDERISRAFRRAARAR